MRLKPVSVSTEYSPLVGGLDQASPPLTIKAGRLIDCVNYEAGVLGGYQRIDGYERFDGRPSPSDAVYYFAPTETSLVDIVDVGDIITGDTSGAIGIVARVTEEALNLTKVFGNFEIEDILLSGDVIGRIIEIPTISGELSIAPDAEAKNAAADIYRNDISGPTGSGPIRGLALLNGVLYCFRNNVAGNAGKIFKATSSGWVEVPLYSQISFISGVESIPDGTFILQSVSGASAIVRRTVLESGEWGSTAQGRFIISNIAGTFNKINVITVLGVTKATASSTVTPITISPGGRYETMVYNFYGSTETKRIYGANGVNKGFEFDGSVYVPINTGMSVDKPEYVYAHKQQLFFSFKGSLQHSGVGNPCQWTAISGANEIGMGDNITGIISLPGKALAIMSRNSSSQLIGNNVDDYVLDGISDEVGCIPRTVQRLGYSYCLDDRGIIGIVPTDSFGNFENSTISHIVQPAIDQIRSKVVASSVYRSRNQYRIYGSDGSGICMTITQDNKFAFTKFKYPVNVACVTTGEDNTGKDVVFFGDDQGMVYQADKGSSFDGEEILAFIYLPFNHSKSPTTLKTYRKATIEMTAQNYSQIWIIPDFSYSDIDLPAHIAEEIPILGEGGHFDMDLWNSFFYDATVISSPSIRINGTGVNIGFVLFSKSEIDYGHKFDGIFMHYTPRRLSR